MGDKIYPVRLLSRTSSVLDWRCQRARYWGNEYLGRGISKSTTSLALFTGIVLHDSLAAIATYHQQGVKVPIDTIATIAFNQIYDNLSAVPEGEMVSTESVEWAKEQGSLTEGIIRGYYRHVWPRLLAQYPKIVAIEQEVEYRLSDGFIFMAKPDLILEDNEGQWHYCVGPKTRILTNNLIWTTAENIKEGDIIIGVEEIPANTPTDKNGQYRRAARQWNSGKVLKTALLNRPSYRLNLTDGTSIVCSEDHMWLVPQARGNKTRGGTLCADWIKTSELKAGSKLLKIIEPWDDKTWESYDAGYIGAALDGEGCLAQKATSGAMSLTFAQKANPMLEKFLSTIEKYQVDFTLSKNSKGTHHNVDNVYISQKAQCLRIMGITRPERLIKKIDFDGLGGAAPIKNLRIESIEFIGNQPVIAMETSNHTFLAEGIVSHNCEFKSTSSKKAEWINSWDTAVQLHSSIKAVEQTMGQAPIDVILVGMYKGYISYGKQSSPFCYAYKKSGNPPFTQDQIEYAYKSGFKRYATWDLPGGVKKWVEEMPETILADQFPLTAPIFVNDDLIERFFKQRLIRETEIRDAMQRLAEYPDEEQLILDTHFQQKFDVCQPSFGWSCEYKKLCHSQVSDPLSEGFQLREPHHLREAEMYAQES